MSCRCQCDLEFGVGPVMHDGRSSMFDDWSLCSVGSGMGALWHCVASGKWQVGVVGRGRSRHYRLCEPHSCQSLKSDLFDSRVGGPDAFSLGIFAFNMPIVLSVNLCCRNSGSRRDGLTVTHAVIFLMHAWSFIRDIAYDSYYPRYED